MEELEKRVADLQSQINELNAKLDFIINIDGLEGELDNLAQLYSKEEIIDCND